MATPDMKNPLLTPLTPHCMATPDMKNPLLTPLTPHSMATPDMKSPPTDPLTPHSMATPDMKNPLLTPLTPHCMATPDMKSPPLTPLTPHCMATPDMKSPPAAPLYCPPYRQQNREVQTGYSPSLSTMCTICGADMEPHTVHPHRRCVERQPAGNVSTCTTVCEVPHDSAQAHMFCADPNDDD